MQEGLATEHSSELLADTLEEFLDSGAVANERGGHLQTAWRDVADGGLHVVGDPLNEVAAVLVLHVQHLLVNLLHGHAPTEHGSHGQVAAVTGIAGGHHVLCIEHLLGELWYGECTVLLGPTAGQGSESGHEEVETGEGYHVDCQFAEIGIQLTRESKAGGHSTHGCRDKVVKIAVGGGGELQCAEADIVERFVVNAVGLIGVFYKLVNGEGGVVGLYNSVRNFRGWNDAESVHDPVGVLLTDLGDEKRTHARAGTATKGVSELEALKAVTALGLLTNNIENRVNEFSSLSVVTLSPVVTSTTLTYKGGG